MAKSQIRFVALGVALLLSLIMAFAAAQATTSFTTSIAPYYLNVTSTGPGIVSSVSGYYTIGSTVSISATAASGGNWCINWVGKGSGSYSSYTYSPASTISVTMNAPINETANFVGCPSTITTTAPTTVPPTITPSTTFTTTIPPTNVTTSFVESGLPNGANFTIKINSLTKTVTVSQYSYTHVLQFSTGTAYNSVVNNNLYLSIVYYNGIEYLPSITGLINIGGLTTVNYTQVITTTIPVNATLSTPIITTPTPSITLGQQATISGSWNGGIPPYTISLYQATYSYCGNITQIYSTSTSGTSFNYTFKPSTIGTKYYCVLITDHAGIRKISSVNPGINVSSSTTTVTTTIPSSGYVTLAFLPNASVTVGQSVQASIYWSGAGTPPFYLGLAQVSTNSCNSASVSQALSWHNATVSQNAGGIGFLITVPQTASNQLYYCLVLRNSLNNNFYSNPAILHLGATTTSTTTVPATITPTSTFTTTIPPSTFQNAINMSVGQNITSGPWTIQFQDLGGTTSGINPPAEFAIFYNGQLTNVTNMNVAGPGYSGMATFAYGGSMLHMYLSATSSGLYAYQKHAVVYPWYLPMSNISVGSTFVSGLWTLQLNSLNPASFYISLFEPQKSWVLTNSTSISSGTTAVFNVSGNILYLELNKTSTVLNQARFELWTSTAKNVNTANFTTTFTESGLPAGAIFTLAYANQTKSIAVTPNSDAILSFSTKLGNYGYTLYNTAYGGKNYVVTGQIPAGFFTPGSSVVIYYSAANTTTTTTIPVNNTPTGLITQAQLAQTLGININSISYQVSQGLSSNFNVSDASRSGIPVQSVNTLTAIYNNGNEATIEFLISTNQPQNLYNYIVSQLPGHQFNSSTISNGIISGVTYTMANNPHDDFYFLIATKGNKVVSLDGSPVSQISPSVLVNAVVYDLSGINTTTTTTIPTTPTTTIHITPYNGSAYNPATGTATITISKGWNIIPNVGLSTSQLAACQQDYGAHYFMYSPQSGTYLNYGQLSSLSSSQESYSYPYTGWFYSSANCNIQYNISADNQQYQSTTNLAKGWNFFTVKPWMLNETFGTEFGNCNINEIAFWNATSQSWSTLGGSSSKSSQISSFEGTNIGAAQIESSMLLKVSAACNLHSASTAIPTPPPPPSSVG